ncbi:MAG: hypothetical protein ACRC0G_09685 [Fusobacteriaceae bacterium]
MIKLFHKSKITKEDVGEIKLIDGSDSYYCNKDGEFFRECKDSGFIRKKTYLNKLNGYLYIGISFNKVYKTYRTHKIIAKTFIEKNDGFDIVGHLDNNKTNNKVGNLYWTTVGLNTKKAVDDGLLKTDKNEFDSQSIQVAIYKNNGEFISAYGSISEAGRLIKGTNKSTIAKVIDKTTKGLKGFYFKSLTLEEYKNSLIKKMSFEIPYIPKTKTQVKVTRISTDEKFIFENQKKAADFIGTKQPVISHYLKRKKSLNDYFLERVI